MPLFEIILIILLTGTWFAMHDIPFSFAGSVRVGAFRVREMGVVVMIGLSAGYLLLGSSLWHQQEAGWRVSSPAVVFVIALSVACTMLALTKVNPLNSACYALTGAIWGWQLFDGSLLHHLPVVSTCVVWLLAPVLSGVLAAALFSMLHALQRRHSVHLIRLSARYRVAIRLAVAVAALAIGVNNAPLFIGFVHAPGVDFGAELGTVAVNDRSLLWFMTLLVLFAALYPVARRQITSLHPGFVTRKPEQAFVVLLSMALVLFLFGSRVPRALLGIDVTPVSPVHLSLGALLGIGVLQKNKRIEPFTLTRLGVSTFVTPFLALCLCFVLLSLIAPYGYIREYHAAVNVQQRFNLMIPLLVLALVVAMSLIVSTFRRQQLLRVEAQNALERERQQHHEAQQVLTGMELKSIQRENERLANTLEIKRKELVNLALGINEQRDFFDSIYQEIHSALSAGEPAEVKARLTRVARALRDKMTFSSEMNGFYSRVEELHKHFVEKLVERFPQLTEQEKRLATLLRLGFSTKEIAGLMHVSPKSAEIGRHRLRKKLGLDREENLISYIKSL
jgi:phosphate/sulfate permease/DNA-binding CsgD family transcriptional regulator